MNSKEAKLYSVTRGIQQTAYSLYMPDLEIKADDKILDVGCGTGDLVYQLGDTAQSVIGFDISTEMIDVARKNYQRHNVAYEVADVVNCAETYPNWKGAFDKVVSVFALHWIKDRRKAFQNIYDCLRPGGECFLLNIGPMDQMLGHNEDELPYYLKNLSKWKEHLKDYENKMYNQISMEDSIGFLESVGFAVLTANSHKPCDELDHHKDNIKDYLRTLLGHLNYLPEQYHEEFLQDATDWCNQNFPVNQRGNKYARLEVMMLRAKKKLN